MSTYAEARCPSPSTQPRCSLSAYGWAVLVPLALPDRDLAIRVGVGIVVAAALYSAAHYVAVRFVQGKPLRQVWAEKDAYNRQLFAKRMHGRNR